jgi:hypothetical protein
MSKTRDELFQRSFNIFFTEYIESRQINTYKWDLKKTTRKKNASLHKYKFAIPRSYLQYSISERTDQDGFVFPVEEVYSHQFVPDSTTFTAYLNAYFSDYHITKEGNLVSYVKFENEPTDTEDYIATIYVKYINGVFPYPYPPTEIEIANQNISTLNSKIISMQINAEIGLAIYSESIAQTTLALTNEISSRISQIESMTRMLCQMKSRLRDRYARGEPEDCPVCYEPISTDKLVIPDCCHYICSTCSDRCNICPICRSGL